MFRAALHSHAIWLQLLNIMHTSITEFSLMFVVSLVERVFAPTLRCEENNDNLKPDSCLCNQVSAHTVHAHPGSAKCSYGAAQCRYMIVIVLDSFQVFVCV